MSNLTISMDDQLIKQARVRAIQQGTSLSAKVREFLQQYANGSDDVLQKQREEATARLMATMEAATAQTTQATSTTPLTAAKSNTLRSEMYDGDYRTRDRMALPPSQP